MLHFNYCLNLFLAPEVIASTCNLFKTQIFTLQKQNQHVFLCVCGVFLNTGGLH